MKSLVPLATFWVVLVATSLSLLGTARAQTPVPRADTTRIDTARTAADTTGAARDTTLARPDLPTPQVPKPAVITTRPPAPARRGRAAPEPPYRIEADRMSGGRGPQGDVLFLEKVTITRTKTRLTADRGRYERTTGMVHLDGNVRVRDSSATVTCDQASFSETEDRLDLRGNVELVDKNATLRAPFGWYDRRAGIAQLSGGVSGREGSQRLIADEATYVRDSSLVKARGKVIGRDEENRVELESTAIDFNRGSRVATAFGRPVMRARDEDGTVTTLRARLLRVDNLNRIAEAIDSVQVERDTLRATANYAMFDDSTGRGIMLGQPKAWDNETTLTGDTLLTYATERKLDRLVVLGNAQIDYLGGRESNRGEQSRLTGERVDMFVRESGIDSLVATGNAKNAYTAVAQAGKTPERNDAEGDTIVVFFDDRKLDRARVQGGASGEYRPPVAVEDTAAARLERILYDSRRIEFVIPRNKIVLEGDAHLSYREMELNARRVEFDSEANTLVAEGKPQLVEKGDEVSGQLMTYDMERRVGTIYQATTKYEQGLYHGERIRKASENQLDVLGGAYSTCDQEHPHYHFSARYMKIYLKDKLIAKPVVFYLRNIPLLALPFYVFPIKPGRHSGFLFPQFEFGFNNRTGQFIRNAGYYWAPNDYMDFTAAGDYYQQQPAWLLRGEANYKLLYAFDGHLEGRYERNEDPLNSRDDYKFYGTHVQTIGERTRLSALGDFISSREYAESPLSGQSLQERLDRFLTSSVQLSHYADWISLNAVVDRRQDLEAEGDLQRPNFSTGRFDTVGTVGRQRSLTVQAPSLSATLPTRALGSYGAIKDHALGKWLASTYLSLSGRYLSLSTRTPVVIGRNYFTRFDTTFTDTTRTVIAGIDTVAVDSANVVGSIDETRRGAASTFSLTDSRRLFGWINFSPSIFGQAVVFDRDEQGHKLVPATTWQASSGLSTTLYRTMSTPVSGLALRHVFSPSVGLSYSPDFPSLRFTDPNGIERERFRGFGEIGIFSAARSARAQFSIDQRIQAKYSRGDRVTRLDNLLTWTTSSSYDFLWRQNNLQHPLGPVISAVRLQPPGYVNIDASGFFDVYSQRPLQSFSWNLGTSFSNAGGKNPQATRTATESGAGLSTAQEDASAFRESWSVSLAYSYAGGYSGQPRWSSRETLNGVLRYQLTENWTFDYQAGYDLTERAVLLQRYNLTRRIHCWDATFSRSFTGRGEVEYYFRLGIRDQKEIYYERGSRVQSFGGIN